jgi:4-amino-4-deoxy-L-arabinose transferase-like glycosyltransferase
VVEKEASTTVRQRLALLGLTLFAFVLRVCGTGYGFPLPWARPDETRWVKIAIGLIENPDPSWFEWPTLHGYLLATVYWFWGKFRVWHGDFPNWHAYLNEDQSVYPADQVLLGRIVSALIGALVVPLVWKLGKRLGPPSTGFLAAFFVAVSFGPVRDSHWALIEALLLFGIVSTLILVLRALEQPTLARFLIAGIAAGLTASAKYSGASLAIPITAAAMLARSREGKSWIGSLWDPRLVLAGVATIVAFLAGSPFILVSRAQFMGAMVMREWSYRDASFGTDVGFVHHILFSLRHSHGVLMEALGIVGLLVFGRRSAGALTILAYGVGTYLAIGPARIIPMRYASSLAPSLVLGAAWLLLWAGERLKSRAVVAALALLCAAEPLYKDVRFDMLLTRPDTRNAALQWLLQHHPESGFVMAPDSKAMKWGRPDIESRYELVSLNNRRVRIHAAPYVVLSESPTGYIPWTPELNEFVRQQGGVMVALFDPYAPNAHPVYDPHDAFFVPVSGFEGVLQPGPRVTIYGWKPEPDSR